MSLYRLQPTADRRWWATLFGVTAVVLLLPAALLLVVPTRAVSHDVELGMSEYDWTVPLDLSCRPATDTIVEGWRCGDVLVQTIVVEGGTDPDRTLRRMTRAMSYGPAPRAEILREGDARMVIDDLTGSVGVSVEGTGEREGLTLVAVLTGPGHAVAPLTDSVWRELAGTELPEIVREAIATPAAPALPLLPEDPFGGTLRNPLELTQVVAA